MISLFLKIYHNPLNLLLFFATIMKTIALIIARGGSQRVPGKNIRILGGKPLIAWSIECARDSQYIDRVIVSTDSDEIAEVSREFGAEVPFRRPAELATWDAKEVDAIGHALNWLSDNESYHPELLALLRPTSPFRKTSTLDKAIQALMNDESAHSTRSIIKCHEHPYKMWVNKGKRMEPFIPTEKKGGQTHNLSYQLLPPVWIQNASFDVLRTSNISELNSTTGTEIIPIEMDEYESIDINNEIDFLTAEAALSQQAKPTNK